LSKSNNFDLIRLFAALQVATVHSMQHLHLGVTLPGLGRFLDFFPGVPIFFFVSGFLISNSYERNPAIKDFTLNRCLRIYPALIVCFLVSIGSVIASGYFHGVRIDMGIFAVWTAAQLSFFQFFNPQFMRGYGSGVLNGSMWTICVELQFYALTPVIHRLTRMRWRRKSAPDLLILGLAGLFLVANRVYFLQAPAAAQSLTFKLLGVSFIPWFYMFLAGVFVQRNFAAFRALLGGRFIVSIAAYLVFAAAVNRYAGLRLGNEISPFLFLALIAAIFSAAFSRQTLSDRLLRRNDVSYGVYIYHMPTVNLLLMLGYSGLLQGLWIALITTIGLATWSWLAIERPALSFKTRPMYAHAE
jgi:peptidoglycan/LPS O-acetylase OafA/YrhL